MSYPPCPNYNEPTGVSYQALPFLLWTKGLT